MTARMIVRFAGPHVSVQDGGRPGLARFGVPTSGAMDRLAMAAANTAVGNDPGQPASRYHSAGCNLIASKVRSALQSQGAGSLSNTPRKQAGHRKKAGRKVALGR